MKLFKTSYNHYSDEQLMALVANQRDNRAFEQLYDRYARKLTAFCSRLVQSKEIGEDLVHETFIRIIEQPQSFDQGLRFSTWIYTIAHRLSLNTIRNTQNRDVLLNQNYAVETFYTSFSGIDSGLIKTAVNTLYKTLSEKEKAIFVLRFEHDLNLKEIAAIIDIPEGSVKSCLFYLLKKFDSHLQPFKTT